MKNPNQKLIIKAVTIVVLSLLLLITLPFIKGLIQERENFQTEVIYDVTSKWGSNQTIYGPFLYVEYNEMSTDANGKQLWQRQNFLQSPLEQTITGAVKTQNKKRSLYEVTLYNANLELQATFPSLDKIASSLKLVDKESFITTKILFSISDNKGFTEQILINNNPAYPLEFESKINLNNNITFLSVDLNHSDLDPTHIKFPINIKGSTQLTFLANAKVTNINIQPNYKDIKYIENYLPDAIEANADNAVAKWSIYQSIPFNTSIDQFAKADEYKFGLEFLQINDFYSKVNRATKYALLFIGLTFITCFFLENLKNLSLNIFHYALIGLALCINFVLLLSISEYVGFEWSYLISSISTIVLVTTFIYSISKNKRIGLTIFGLLIFLYAFLFFLLQLKESALIVGSVGLFVILAILMYFSKKIDLSIK